MRTKFKLLHFVNEKEENKNSKRESHAKQTRSHTGFPKTLARSAVIIHKYLSGKGIYENLCYVMGMGHCLNYIPVA